MGTHRKDNQVKKDRRLRIIWSSNGHWTNSGYGVFTRDILFRMKADGWPIAEISFWGLEGYPVMIDGIKVYPKMTDAFGTDALYHHSKVWGANVAMTMQDVPLLGGGLLARLQNEGIPWIPYVPIDKLPCPPPVAERLKLAHKIVTFSQFGHDALQDAGFASTLILEGTDTNIFKPMNKIESRLKLKLPPNVFLWGMIAANKENPPRKGFQEALQALKMFQDKHPEAALMIHTQQPSPTGFPVQEFANYIGLNMSQLFFMEEYKAIWGSDSHVICEEMNAMDALLHPSQTEGFGLTVIEAAACGVPSVVNGTTSMPEMVIPGVTGEICKTGAKRFTNDLSWTEAADVDSLYEKMELVYAMIKDHPEKVRDDCRNHILDKYSIDKIYVEKWTPFFEKLQTKLLGPAVA